MLTLGLFAALAFLPSSWAAYTLRVYRDNIFPALCLYFFAGMAGMALRAVFTPEKPLWPWLAAAGAGLACGYLDREDAGLFLLPFAAAATVIVAVVLAGKRRWKALAAQVIPYVMLGVGVLTFCTLNYTHYGVFALSDFSEGSFAAAMGAMMRGHRQHRALPLRARRRPRENLRRCAGIEPLAYWLEEDAQLQNDFRDPNLDDYRAGSFYWAIRRAAQFEGIYADAKTADAYWQTVADKINAACDAGTLPSRTGRRVATSQPISAAYVPPTLAETWNGFWHVLGLRDCAPYETLRSIGTEDDFAAWSGYLHCGFNSAANAGRTRPTTARTKRRFCRHAGLDAGLQYFAYGGRALRRAVPADRAFAAAASKMHGTDRCAVAAAVRHLRHCAAALCHDRLCRGVQLRHRHQHDVPGNGASAAGPVRICRGAFVRQTEKN